MIHSSRRHALRAATTFMRCVRLVSFSFFLKQTEDIHSTLDVGRSMFDVLYFFPASLPWAFKILAQVSRNVTVRLKTGAREAASFESMQK
jgi:hypothetical protein